MGFCGVSFQFIFQDSYVRGGIMNNTSPQGILGDTESAEFLPIINTNSMLFMVDIFP